MIKTGFFFLISIVMLPVHLLAQQDAAELSARDYTMAVAWQQHSGEYRALSFQAYNFARLSLLERLKTADQGKRNCVVVDIDETVLDNSPFQGHEVKSGVSFVPKDWTAWTALAKADTVAGALSFLNFAAAHQVETFYITNRDRDDEKATLTNLQKFGFPYADTAHLMVNISTSDKEPRRQKVLEKYNILLLCGDNLSDFSNVFYREGKNTLEQVEKAKTEFGSHFILLPNPMYGDWEKLLYTAPGLDAKQKAKQRLDGLKSY